MYHHGMAKRLALAVATLPLLLSASTLLGSQSIPGGVAPIASPAGPNSAQPQLTVSSRGVLLSWIERTGEVANLKFAERTKDGWSAARTVSSGRDWFVNWADVPSVLRLS